MKETWANEKKERFPLAGSTEMQWIWCVQFRKIVKIIVLKIRVNEDNKSRDDKNTQVANSSTPFMQSEPFQTIVMFLSSTWKSDCRESLFAFNNFAVINNNKKNKRAAKASKMCGSEITDATTCNSIKHLKFNKEQRIK